MSNINVITLKNNVCVSVKSVKEDYVLQENELLADSFDETILGKTYSAGEFVYTDAQLEEQARIWRNLELEQTDTLMLLPDYPNKEALTAYRQALRDWPNTESFPETKPVLGPHGPLAP